MRKRFTEEYWDNFSSNICTKICMRSKKKLLSRLHFHSPMYPVVFSLCCLSTPHPYAISFSRLPLLSSTKRFFFTTKNVTMYRWWYASPRWGTYSTRITRFCVAIFRIAARMYPRRYRKRSICFRPPPRQKAIATQSLLMLIDDTVYYCSDSAIKFDA